MSTLWKACEFANKIHWPRITALGCLFAGSFLAEACAGEAKPNVVVILADDLGYGDPACYGGQISTPNLDGLAAAGMRFTDAHTSSSVCSPTRYGLLTGRYNWRSKLKHGVLGGLSPRLIEPDRLTIGSLLQAQGYTTAAVGKWHLGMNWVVKPGASVTELGIEPREQVFNVEYGEPIAAGPNSVGFDYYYGISASLDMVPYTFIENNRVVALPTEDRSFLMMHGRPKGGRTRQGPAAPGFDAVDVLPAIASKTCEFIEKHAAMARQYKPFFIYVPLTAPHTPILPSRDWQGKSDMTPYADFVMQTDAAVGQILAALEEQQLDENTLVIVTSDNGCSPSADFAQLAEHGHYPSGPLRGHKADIFEGGHRVPFIVRWPGKVGAGTKSTQLICLTDVLATVAEIVGAPLSDNAAEDSISFLPTLQGKTSAGRDHLVSHSINGSFAIRKGPWKLLLCPDSGGWSQPRPGTPASKSLPSRQLYNLDEDLGEQTNLIDQNSEMEQHLHALLQDMVDRGRTTPGGRQPNTGQVDIEPSR